jgi:hypothetical protein
MDDNIKSDILKSIELLGVSDSRNAPIKIVIGSRGHSSQILDFANGLPKVRAGIAKQFDLILSVPSSIKALSPFEVRCSLCERVISYPAWYHKVKYVTNVIHYFICFDSSDSSKPTARCYRKG